MKFRKYIFLIFVFYSYMPVLAQVYEAWVAQYNGLRNDFDQAFAVVADDSGNVYVTGRIEGFEGFADYATIKYDPNGDTLWVRRYNGPGNFSDYALALAVDNSGNVYVTGLSGGSGTFSDYATIKYAPDGNTLWVARYNGPGNGGDGAIALAVDNSGNVYVTGSSWSGSSYDYATIKYAPNGDTTWVRRYNGLGNSDDFVHALAVDSSGNVYVTGESYVVSLDTVPVTSSPTASATSSVIQPLQDELVFLAFSPVNLIVTDPDGDSIGVSFNTILNGSTYNASNDSIFIPSPIVGKYHAKVVLDTLDLSGDTTYTLGIRIDGNDQLILASNVPVPETGESDSYQVIYNSSVDYLTIKYAPNGDTLWVRRYNGPGNYTDVANALAVDTSGNVYVTGYSYYSYGSASSSSDYATIKYAADGDTLWVRRYNGPADSNDKANALAVDGSGNVYVTGQSFGSAGSSDYATIKYKPNGDTLWVRRYNGPGNSVDLANALAVDNSGNVYLTGYSIGSGTDYDYATIKYAANGDTAWLRRYSGLGGNEWDIGLDLDLDARGNVYVTGYSGYSGPGTGDYATIKYSPCSAKPGDANNDTKILLSDIVTIINFVFKSAPAPNPFCRGNANGDGFIDLSDIVYLVNSIFKSGPAPVKSKECCL